MILGIMKRGDFLPDNYHYFLHPIEIKSTSEASLYKKMGYIIIYVNEFIGKKLIQNSKESLAHQIEIAVLAEKALAELKDE